MTNGEKIKEIFPHYDIEIDEHKGYVRVFYEDFYTTYPLSWWNAEYKEPTTKNYSEVSSELDKNSKKLEKDFGELDCISRAQTQTKIEMNASRYTIAKERGGMGQVEWSDQLIKVSDAVDIIRHLPPVTPIRPKGHWVHGKELSKEYRGRILVDVTYADWHCSNCNYVIKQSNKPKWNYCPNCGADMREIEV